MTEPCHQPITVSVVSHGQGRLVAALLEDLVRCPDVSAVVLTQNIPEDDIPCPESLLPHVRLIRNEHPLGFAANHNQAFRQCATPLFAVLNPDIRLDCDPFRPLLEAITASGAGLAAPTVRNPQGMMEDSARYFPTPVRLAAKIFRANDGRILVAGHNTVRVDWVAGMFMLFLSAAFRGIGGFDEGFFLYYEDVDICARLWKTGRKVIFHPGASVIHDAQRTSRKDFRYMMWHMASLARYLAKHFGRLPKIG